METTEKLDTKDRFKQAEFAAMVGIVGNILLAVAKWVIGVYANSKALIADAANSTSDTAGSLAVLIGLKAAKQPPDKDHPYGHGKAESIAAIIVSVLLVLVGFEIGKASFASFFEPIKPPKIIAIFVVVLSMLIKEGMFRYNYRLAKKLNSDALMVTAYDHRSDVYASGAALIGIGCSIFGGKFGMPWLVYADPVAGIVVSIMILGMAWKLGKESIHNTLDHVLHDDETQHLREIVERFPEVKKIGELQAREHGHYVIIDLKIAVDPNMTVEEGHKVGKRVKKKLMEAENVHNVFIHINPFRRDGLDVDEGIEGIT